MFPQLSTRWKFTGQLLFVISLCAIVAAILFVLLAGRPDSGNPKVQFLVEASGGFAIITLQAGDVSISKPTTVTVPWSKTLQIPSGTEVYLTASNPTQTGKITCRITLDKIPWKSATTNAPKDGVACAGIVP
jgi:hypothetical protein